MMMAQLTTGNSTTFLRTLILYLILPNCYSTHTGVKKKIVFPTDTENITPNMTSK